MKIYTLTSPVEGMHEPTYDEVLLSGYTAGYESGYTDGKEECRDYSKEYFTIEALEDGNLIVRKWCDYSINDGVWVSITGETEIPLNDGDKVRFKRESISGGYNGMFSGNTIASLVYGNIMSLAYADDFRGKTQAFSTGHLLDSYTGLVSAENLILPATTLVSGCYESMFHACSNLTTAPELPATTLAHTCYSCMFHTCTSLVVPPELPATTLEGWCYDGMFLGCTSLTTAPELPATTLADFCYYRMFMMCSALTSTPELPALVLAEHSYGSMFSYCTNLTDARAIHATTLANSCCYGMFSHTSLTTAPVLSAATLTNYCYKNMFVFNTNLNYVKCLATDISATEATAGWISSGTGTFVKAAGVSWPTGNSGIPAGWTVIEE